MPVFYQNHLTTNTRLAVWKIEEDEPFFLQRVPLSNTITHPVKRLQHLAGRYLLQHLFPHFPYHQIEIASTRKPFLPGDPFHFSISHCANFAAAVVSTYQRVGVDVEQVTQRVHRVKHKFLHASELRFVNSRPASEQTPLLTLLWSAKEAMYKWWGRGEVDFSEMMRTFPFAMEQSGQIQGCFISPELEQPLLLEYRVLPGTMLVWVVS